MVAAVVEGLEVVKVHEFGGGAVGGTALPKHSVLTVATKLSFRALLYGLVERLILRVSSDADPVQETDSCCSAAAPSCAPLKTY